MEQSNKNTMGGSGRRLERALAFVLAAATISVLIYTTNWWLKPPPITSPLSKDSLFQFLNIESPSISPKIVYGFLPYWNMSEVQLSPSLTHLAYFSLTIGENGKLITKLDGNLEPGYNQLQSEKFLDIINLAETRQQKIELVLTQFNNDDIVNLLSSQTAQQNLLTDIDAMLLAYPFSGINIDIEYSGEVTPNLRQKMTQLVENINQHRQQKYKNLQLSIDMYASAAKQTSIWDVAAISPQVDYIIIMAYDFHQRSSTVAGPVAPVFGGKSLWDSDISGHLREFTKLAPAEKLILGVPFYGYEWQTTTTDARAFTLPKSGATASYKRVQTLLEQKNELNATEGWSEEALSPYLTYQKNGNTYVVYYENSRSLSYKLDYVNQLQLGGVAIWALGYEGEYPELWQVIDRKFSANN